MFPLHPRVVRYCGSALLVLVAVWVGGTFLFLVRQRSGPMPDASDVRLTHLRDRVAAVESAVKRQLDDNREWLQYLKANADKADTLRRQLAEVVDKIENPVVPGVPLSLPADANEPIAVLVFACNRASAVKNHIEQLLKHRPSSAQFPVVVSQDCNHADTRKALQEYGDRITLLLHPDQSDIVLPPKQKKFAGYYKISRHYKWALNQTFHSLGYQTVIVTEDDLDISPDFFEYFRASWRILISDPTLWCVSAWADNAKSDLIDRSAEGARRIYRTDFFPGLGWMLRRTVWDQLLPDWPASFWDDWMRRPEQRHDRACLRPEVPRTGMSSFGKVGVSKGQFFDKHLKLIQLNNEYVKFTEMDLSYLLKSNYDTTFTKTVYHCTEVTLPEVESSKFSNGTEMNPANCVRLTYGDAKAFKAIAKKLKLMDDFRAGVPRTAYLGVVPIMKAGRFRVFITPPLNWQGYDITWN